MEQLRSRSARGRMVGTWPACTHVSEDRIGHRDLCAGVTKVTIICERNADGPPTMQRTLSMRVGLRDGLTLTSQTSCLAGLFLSP